MEEKEGITSKIVKSLTPGFLKRKKKVGLLKDELKPPGESGVIAAQNLSNVKEEKSGKA